MVTVVYRVQALVDHVICDVVLVTNMCEYFGSQLSHCDIFINADYTLVLGLSLVKNLEIAFSLLVTGVQDVPLFRINFDLMQCVLLLFSEMAITRDEALTVVAHVDRLRTLVGDGFENDVNELHVQG